ncbi:MAG: mandelate racemase/muconate lactonizing enzyme family protein [Deltaproteobacteria bacterium]
MRKPTDEKQFSSSRRRWLRKPLELGAAAAGLALLPGESRASAAGPVKITAVETWILSCNSLFVIVRTDQGITGYGEASPMNVRAIAAFINDALVKLVVGENALDRARLWDKMSFTTYKLGVQGTQTEAIAAIDIALWDIFGKVTGQSLWQLFGGRRRERVRMYASNGGRSRMTPAEMAHKAALAAEQGHSMIKVRTDWGTARTDADPAHDWAVLSEVRKAIGDKVELGFDVNNGYSVSTAIRMGRRYQDELKIMHYEEPVAQYDYPSIAQVVAALDVPIAAGEQEYTRWQFRDLITQANVDVVQPDLVKCGGITEALNIAALVSTYNRVLVPHQTQPAIGIAATLHFTACFAREDHAQEYDINDKRAILNKIIHPALEQKNGYLPVPDGPGLGLEIDEAGLSRLRTPA